MNKLRIVDLGNSWGHGLRPIFEPWLYEKKATYYTPRVLDCIASLDSADLLCFGGGQDIHPSIYGNENVASMCGPSVSARDRLEMQAYTTALRRGIPVIGVCRGSQLMCALNGGKLIQDVHGHGIGGTHPIWTSDGRKFEMTSTHHQMWYLKGSDHQLIAWTHPLSKPHTHDIKEYEDPGLDPEVAFYPQTKTLGIQGHPEYLDSMHPTSAWTRELIARLCLQGSREDLIEEPVACAH